MQKFYMIYMFYTDKKNNLKTVASHINLTQRRRERRENRRKIDFNI